MDQKITAMQKTESRKSMQIMPVHKTEDGYYTGSLTLMNQAHQTLLYKIQTNQYSFLTIIPAAVGEIEPNEKATMMLAIAKNFDWTGDHCRLRIQCALISSTNINEARNESDLWTGIDNIAITYFKCEPVTGLQTRDNSVCSTKASTIRKPSLKWKCSQALTTTIYQVSDSKALVMSTDMGNEEKKVNDGEMKGSKLLAAGGGDASGAGIPLPQNVESKHEELAKQHKTDPVQKQSPSSLKATAPQIQERTSSLCSKLSSLLMSRPAAMFLGVLVGSVATYYKILTDLRKYH